ncbi:YitT family protein [Nitrospirillum amazonense]|uniref:YitT family protein n=1 Tax=Nitrospirillum amazonense TaxID=28077 RepID=UPI002DD44A1D|nr:YitT family protein [Nitrospirillum amazonense]MEC4590546.1 YitT family protein [Nitrospirillum amazonense]
MMNPVNQQRHKSYEDLAALGIGTLLVSLGTVLYAKATLLVGSIAGLALLLHYVTDQGFWLFFFVLNLPFYILAWRRMGWRFTARTFAAVCLVTVETRLTPGWVDFAVLNPVYAALAGGGLIGTGLLILFRHRIGLGGINILALYLQERFGIRAGYVQLGLDAAILTAACFVLTPQRLALSVMGAFVANMIVAMNHRADRYLGLTADPAR